VPAGADATVTIGQQVVWSGNTAAVAGAHREGEYVVVPLSATRSDHGETIQVAVFPGQHVREGRDAR